MSKFNRTINQTSNRIKETENSKMNRRGSMDNIGNDREYEDIEKKIMEQKTQIYNKNVLLLREQIKSMDIEESPILYEKVHIKEDSLKDEKNPMIEVPKTISFNKSKWSNINISKKW